ncbi:MAG: hypothetical protein ISEC1_P1620 [Thiomicrorhabdus sp.]|nr:MAG: hypothetical protein ISEC1_P1620 [Thiomicrorhabdus sp.]
MKNSTYTSLIDGVVGSIEVRCHQAPMTNKAMKLVVLSHPHPLYGGTMNNKVITTMERAFYHLGYVTVAYNFRGVGASEGEYDNGDGEQDDLIAVVDWAKQQFNVEHITLAAFSFGSYVSLRASKKITVDALCTVAPPVGLYDFSGIHPITEPWVMIQGGKDEVVSASEILDWAMSGEVKPDLYWRADASHFFHGELIWLKKVILMAY